MGILEPLLARQLLVVTGKGGVGKTAVSAALGRALAAAGRRVLVVEVDPRENVHQMLGIAPSGGQILPAGPAGSGGPGLWVQNLKPRQVLDDIVREQVRIELLARRVLESSGYDQFAASAPGLKELAILGHAFRLLRGLVKGAPTIDLVVIDAPATGHGVTLLTAPRLVSEVIRQGPFGRMAAELAGWLADPGRSGVVVVTLAEEMPVEEALELVDTLTERFGRGPELLVVNGLYPELGAAASEASPLVDLWRRRRELNDRELLNLKSRWAGPRVELPQLPLDRGPALIQALETALQADAWS
ncbi:MAG TPA: ArsA-related P-loop ATPase [Thermoanaerobaculia bacterium]|nr:ArsA-related P-loop ATPase [Thermoanaerobaculia bacterium]